MTGPDDESEICGGCNGSGEGRYDGSTCNSCGGCGEQPAEPNDDYEPDYDSMREDREDLNAEVEWESPL